VVKALDQLSREHPVARFIDPSEVLLLVASSALVVGTAYLFDLDQRFTADALGFLTVQRAADFDCGKAGSAITSAQP
jgi:hypothetical protein